MDDERPVPDVTIESKPYWDAAAEGRLIIQKCAACGAFRPENLPASPICAQCWSLDFAWTEVSGRGVIETMVRMHRGPGYFRDKTPYPVAYVRLAEGPLMLTNLVGPGRDDARVGTPVAVTFEAAPGGMQLPQFQVSG
jgi:uncharacterized OB-fold protein